MDRVLLKRLLGAGVIVALAVIVLPFFLQGDGYEAALRTEIPARPQPPQALETGMVEPSAEVRELLEPPAPLPRPALPPPAAAEPAAPAPQEMDARPQRPAAPSEPAPSAKAAPASPKPVPEAVKPMAPGQWVIQLGSFSADSNAQNLRNQVQRAGVPCQIEPLDIDGRKVWRVRAGPFASQAEADAALRRLQGGLKLGGMVMQVR